MTHNGVKHDAIIHNGVTVTDPLCFANIFNDYFSSIIEKTKVKIKFSNKFIQYFFQDFLPNKESLFTVPTNSHEVNLIISKLYNGKSTCPNRHSSKVLKIF